jgi:hypothetical protein
MPIEGKVCGHKLVALVTGETKTMVGDVIGSIITGGLRVRPSLDSAAIQRRYFSLADTEKVTR